MLHISSRSFVLFITPTIGVGNLPFQSGLDGMLFVFFPSQNSRFSCHRLTMFEWTVNEVYLYSVARTFRKKFQSLARNSDLRLSSAGYEHIPVDFHIPILDIQSPTVLSPNRVLSNVVIQGSFQMGRRDYARIFSQLNASLYGAPIDLSYRKSPDLFIYFIGS